MSAPVKYRLVPSAHQVGVWVLYRWMEPSKGWVRTYPGYWSYEKAVYEHEIEGLKAHLAKPTQHFEVP